VIGTLHLKEKLGRTQIHLDADTLALFPATARGPSSADVALANAIYGRPRQNPFNLPSSFVALAVLIACGTAAAWKRNLASRDAMSLCILALVLLNSFAWMEPQLAPLMRNSGTADHLYAVGLAHVLNYALCYLGLAVNLLPPLRATSEGDTVTKKER